MINSNHNRLGTWTSALLGCVLLCGCNHNKPALLHGEECSAANSPTYIGQLNATQAAQGAKTDATLGDQHFQGSNLNSLGQVKLDLITKATRVDEPTMIYLNVSHDSFQNRQAAVITFLQSEGFSTGQIQFAEGTNPNDCHATAYNLSSVYKAEGGTYSGQTADIENNAGLPSLVAK